MLSDAILLHTAFPNASINFSSIFNDPASNKNWEELRLFSVKFDVANAIYVGVEQVGLQFITCDMLRRGSLSVIHYFSAFDIPTWMFLITFIVASELAFKLIEKIIQDKRKCKKSVATVSFLLEQGMDLPETVCYNIIILGWVTMGIIFSNAYKVQNITDLSAPLPPVPIKYFKELLDLNFTIYSRPNEAVDEGLKVMEQYSSHFADAGPDPYVYFDPLENFENKSSAWRSTVYNEPTVFKHFVMQNVSSTFDKLRDLLWNVHEWTGNEIYDKIMTDRVPDVYLKYITNCYRTAYVSYSDEIEESVSILKRLLYTSNSWTNNLKDAVESVTTGKEISGLIHKTWGLHDVRIPNDIAFKRINGLLESGIAKQWYQFERRVKAYANLLLLAHLTSEPNNLN